MPIQYATQVKIRDNLFEYIYFYYEWYKALVVIFTLKEMNIWKKVLNLLTLENYIKYFTKDD